MGVRGLKSFLIREKQVKFVDVRSEINSWKEQNLGLTPIVVVDFVSFTTCVRRTFDGSICGGQFHLYAKRWTILLHALKASGCSLVFFSDLNVQEDKVDVWLSRRDNEFEHCLQIYDWINSGKTLLEILEIDQKRFLSSAFNGLSAIAQTYGEFYFATGSECDLEVAQYAKRNNAMAVITNDTDFLIFDGPWKVWDADSFDVVFLPELKFIEIDKKGIENVCSLLPHHLPLFATLLGNDYTSQYCDQLFQFSKTLWPKKGSRLQTLAHYVRKIGSDLSDLDIRRLTQHIFGRADNKIQQLIRNSLDSYNTDRPSVAINDPIAKKLANTSVYESYMENIAPIIGIILPIYDIVEREKTYPMLLLEWIKRKRGILQFHIKVESPTFTVLGQMSAKEKNTARTEFVSYPDFIVPPLEQLYLGEESSDDVDELNTIRWKIFGWIMSLEEETIQAIKQIPKEFLLISTTLYILVKEEFLNVRQADGILYSENKVLKNEIMDKAYPLKLDVENIRAANLYQNAFKNVRHNFAIAGLLSCVETSLHFDGVFFQKFMRKFCKMDVTECETLMEPVRGYRVYADIS